MTDASKINRMVDRVLAKENAFDSVSALIESKFFPKPWNPVELNRLPPLIKRINRVYSFILHSGAEGVFGLVTDYPVNICLDEVEDGLKSISARKSLSYLRRLKRKLPSGEFPKTLRGARSVERWIKAVDIDDTPAAAKLKVFFSSFASATNGLPEELRLYLRRNQEALVTELLACAKSSRSDPC